MLYVLNEITRGLALCLQDVEFSRDSVLPGGVRTTIAMHCGFKIFIMAAKVEKFCRLYALFFNRYSSFLRSFFSIS